MRNYLIGPLILALLLAGCAGVPLTTMFKLRNLDPMEVDPAQLKVAIRVDERISIPEGGAQVTLKFDAADDSLHIDDTYIIEVIRNPVFTDELFDANTTGESVTVLQLADSDVRRMIHAQALLRPYSEGRGRGTLSFGVDIRDVCSHSTIPTGKLLVDIFIQASDSSGFLPISRDLDLHESGGKLKAPLNGFPGCVESSMNIDRKETAIPTSAHFAAA